MKKADSISDTKYIKELWRQAENSWNSSKVREIKRSIKVAKEYVIKNDMNTNDEIGIEQSLVNFNIRMAQYFNSRVIYSGHAYEHDAMSDFLNNPMVFWEAYDNAEDKEEFLQGNIEIYGASRTKNLFIFAQNAFGLIGNGKNQKVSSQDINRLTKEQRIEVLNRIIDYFKKAYKKDSLTFEKEEIIRSLQNTINELDDLGVLEENQRSYNELMKKSGLDALIVPLEDGTTGKLKMLFDRTCLDNLSYFQLQVMHCFYSNRVGKVEEEIGQGLFFIASGMLKNSSKDVEENLSDTDLKNLWIEYFVFNKIIEEQRGKISEKCVEVAGAEGTEKLNSFKDEDVYEAFFKQYEPQLMSLMEGTRNVREDGINCISAMGLLKINNYLLKDVVLEDIIIQSNKEKINWGYIPEDDKSIMSRYVLIGVDVPGLSMPLRLHIKRERLKKVVKDYLGTDEIPIYIGKDDFEKYGNNIGTPLILPVGAKERDAIKKVAKVEEKKLASNLNLGDEANFSLVRHLACTQLPNPVEKLLKWKTKGTKKYQDYISLDDGKTRRTERISTPKR